MPSINLLPQPRIFASFYVVVAVLISVLNAIALRVLLKQQRAAIRKYEQNNRLFRRAGIMPSFLMATLSSIMLANPYLKQSAGSSASMLFPYARKLRDRSTIAPATSNYAATAFLISLTVAYLLRGAGMVPLFIIVTFFGDKFGPFKKCDYYLAVTFFNNLTGYCCAYSQLGIAIDRFRAIVTPFKKSFTPNQCRIAIALIWVLSAGAAIPAFLVLYSRKSLANLLNVPGGSRLFCQFTKKEHLLIISLQISVGCGFPVIACCVLYSTVIARLWSGGMNKTPQNKQNATASPRSLKFETLRRLSIKRPRNRSSKRERDPRYPVRCRSEFEPLTLPNNTNPQLNVPADKSNRKTNAVTFAKSQTSATISPAVQARKPLSSSSLRRNRNAIKMVIIILILYTVCSIPFYIMTILEIAFKDIKLSFTVEHLHNLLIMTDHWLHVAVYLYFNTSFRQGFVDTICGPALMDCAIAILPHAFVGALLRNRRSARARRSTLDGESIANTHTLSSPRKVSSRSYSNNSRRTISGINLSAFNVEIPDASTSLEVNNAQSGSSNTYELSECAGQPVKDPNHTTADAPTTDKPTTLFPNGDKCFTLSTNTQTHKL